MMARLPPLLRLAQLFALLLTLLFAPTAGFSNALAREIPGQIAVGALPLEARQTLRLIQQGGPFPYSKDGSVFGNYEKSLPVRPRGYYREYTVPTPGLRHRGAQRIIAANGSEFYYTADHYRTFRRIRESP